MEELLPHEQELRSSPDEWQWHVAVFIATRIPSGYLASYGSIARAVRSEHDLAIIARNVAWMRGRLYELLSHETTVPLHRVACKGDVGSLSDSPKTKSYNDRLRGEEGSLRNPLWI